MTSPFPTTIAGFLRAIPGPGQPAVRLTELCRMSGLTNKQGTTALAFLRFFGVVEVTSDEHEDGVSLHAPTETAALFVASLAEYLHGELSLFEDWRWSFLSDRQPGRAVNSAAQLLAVMERRRLQDNPHAKPLRHPHEIAQIVIKAEIPGAGDRYLLRLDADERKYALPGLRRTGRHKSIRDTAKRVLARELDNFFYSEERDHLDQLGVVKFHRISPITGALTAYSYTYYQFKSTLPKLQIGPRARWGRERDLLASISSLGELTPDLAALREILMRLPGGLEGLGRSLQSAE